MSVVARKFVGIFVAICAFVLSLQEKSLDFSWQSFSLSSLREFVKLVAIFE